MKLILGIGRCHLQFPTLDLQYDSQNVQNNCSMIGLVMFIFFARYLPMLPIEGFTRQLVLRIYPPRFARAVCDLVEGMKMTARGQPQITMESTPPAIETIQLDWEFDTSLWQYVDFGEVFAYLRGSTNLNIPEPWKTIIPRKLS